MFFFKVHVYERNPNARTLIYQYTAYILSRSPCSYSDIFADHTMRTTRTSLSERKHTKKAKRTRTTRSIPQPHQEDLTWMDIPVSRLIKKLSSPHEATRTLTEEESNKLHNVLFNLGLHDGMNLDFQNSFAKRFRTQNRFHCGVVVSILLLSEHNPIDPFTPYAAHNIDAETSARVDVLLQALGKQLLKVLR